MSVKFYFEIFGAQNYHRYLALLLFTDYNLFDFNHY
jgi:hypothetical protein